MIQKGIGLLMIGGLAAANALPDPSHYSSIGWFMVMAASAIVGIGRLLDIYKTHFKEQPAPAATYLTKADFELFRKERKEEVREIEESIEALSRQLSEFSSDNYNARKAMHKEINSHAVALAYAAGKMEREGDAQAAQQIRQIITKGQAG